MNNNFLSFLFAGLILLLVFTTGVVENNSGRPVLDSRVNTTSFTAGPVQQPFSQPASQRPTINAAVALVKELGAARDMFIVNPHQSWPLASLTKLMTATVALEKFNKDQEIVLSREAILTEGTAGNFRTGEVFSVQDLIKAMLAVSSNDAAAALAENYPRKSTTGFISAMREKAQELRMTRTSFFDPAGLSLSNQSNIRDVEKLINYIFYAHPEMLTWSGRKEVEITELKSKIKRKLKNINWFAGRPDFLGGKTGYLDEADGNLVSLFRLNGRPILIIVLGAEDRFKETEKLWRFYKSSEY